MSAVARSTPLAIRFLAPGESIARSHTLANTIHDWKIVGQAGEAHSIYLVALAIESDWLTLRKPLEVALETDEFKAWREKIGPCLSAGEEITVELENRGPKRTLACMAIFYLL